MGKIQNLSDQERYVRANWKYIYIYLDDENVVIMYESLS